MTKGSTIHINRYQSIKLHSVHKFLLQLQILLVSFQVTVLTGDDSQYGLLGIWVEVLQGLQRPWKRRMGAGNFPVQGIVVLLRIVIRPRIVVQSGVVVIPRLHKEGCILYPLCFHVAEHWLKICRLAQ